MVPAARIPNPDRVWTCASRQDHLREAHRGDFSGRDQKAESPQKGAFFFWCRHEESNSVNPNHARTRVSNPDHLRLTRRAGSCCIRSKKSPRLRRAFLIGAGSKNRTRDLMITNQLLYQLSYAGEMRQGRELFPFVSAPARTGRPLRAIRADRRIAQSDPFFPVLLND